MWVTSLLINCTQVRKALGFNLGEAVWLFCWGLAMPVCSCETMFWWTGMPNCLVISFSHGPS